MIRCDKCLKRVKELELEEVSFLYLDKNDNTHEDMSHLIGLDEVGYRQYRVCKQCKKDGY